MITNYTSGTKKKVFNRNHRGLLILKQFVIAVWFLVKVSPAGFEPALPKELELKSSALDHSAIETWYSWWGSNPRLPHYKYGTLTN